MRNNAWLSSGGDEASDEVITPRYVVEPIVKYLKAKNFKVVWCPFDTVVSQHVRVLYKEGFDVRFGHRDIGLDFFKYECPEADVIVSNPPFSCYSDDTEVFTKRGWIRFPNILPTDEVLSVNNKKEISWDKISRIIKKEVNEDLYHFKNKNMDLLVTSDHRMFAYNKYSNELCIGKDGDLLRASEIGSKHYFPKNGYTWKGEINNDYLVLPHTKNPPKSKVSFYPELKIPLIDWLPFFGLWLADGFVSTYKGTGHGYTVGIKQGESRWREVENILNKLPFKYSKYINKIYPSDRERKADYAIYQKQLWDYMNQFGKSQNKFILSWIKNLPVRYLKLLIYGYTLGDSFRHKGINSITTSIHYGSVSKQLLEDIQEILLKLGNITNISHQILNNGNDYYRLILNKDSCSNRAMYIRKNPQNKEPYNGLVYCLTLKENSIFLVRRNNKIIFCGNCKDQVLERLYKLDKPFMVLFPVQVLQGKKRTKLFMKYGLEYLGFDSRPCFYTKNDLSSIKTGNHFASGYYCRNVLPEKLIFEELKLIQEPFI